MSISDAYVMVCCDAPHCQRDVEIPLSFTYGGIMHATGSYDHRDSAVERKLLAEEWVVQDGRHYCCAECAEDAAAEVSAEPTT